MRLGSLTGPLGRLIPFPKAISALAVPQPIETNTYYSITPIITLVLNLYTVTGDITPPPPGSFE